MVSNAVPWWSYDSRSCGKQRLTNVIMHVEMRAKTPEATNDTEEEEAIFTEGDDNAGYGEYPTVWNGKNGYHASKIIERCIESQDVWIKEVKQDTWYVGLHSNSRKNDLNGLLQKLTGEQKLHYSDDCEKTIVPYITNFEAHRQIEVPDEEVNGRCLCGHKHVKRFMGIVHIPNKRKRAKNIVFLVGQDCAKKMLIDDFTCDVKKLKKWPSAKR